MRLRQLAGHAVLAAVLAGSRMCMASQGNNTQQPDYGAATVNAMAATEGVHPTRTDDFDYLALKDHHGPSGVPLGGIGVGCFDYAPDGRFTRICLNNWHAHEPARAIVEAPGSFLAVWSGGQARLLHRAERPFAGMTPALHTTYRGLFPTVECRVDDLATVRAWSGLVPHNVKDSSLPLAWIEVQVRNDTGAETPLAIAFSWQDVIGREIVDIRDREMLARTKDSFWDRSKALGGWSAGQEASDTGWTTLPRVATSVSALAVGRLRGVRQHAEPLRPVLRTFQSCNNEVTILAEAASGIEVTTLPAFEVDNPDEAWASFRRDGRFPKIDGDHPLFDPSARREMASAVAARLTLKPGETRTVRFILAWFEPENPVNPRTDPAGTFFGTADYGRFYHNHFRTLSELLAYASRERGRIERETRAWQEPILASTYPEWLQFKVINSAYTLYTNTILNKAGDFAVLEGAMGGLAGTMDQRISAHPIYQKFFPALDRSELELFGHTAGTDGRILHFDGHYYMGLATRDGKTPTPDGWMVDNSGGWLLQLAKDYQQTGDLRWLEQFRTQVPRTLKFLESLTSERFAIPVGPTTYDDFWHPPLYAYNATTYPSSLQAGAVLMRAFGHHAEAKRLEQKAAKAAEDAILALWNGRFFAYGADPDGANRRDDVMFSGQTAGPFISRTWGWDDPFPLAVTQSSLVAQMKTNVGHTKDCYAPKVWNIARGDAMRDPNRPDDPNNDSTCWPFYLESYTAMAAIQAGFVEDGLTILEGIQRVHLRNGWTWTQNLWRPAGDITYMTAPVSWFITDVMAGASLDVPNHTLGLGPIFRDGETSVRYPLFFPRFWAILRGDRDRKSLRLEIVKTFGKDPVALEKVRALPIGVPSAEARVLTIPRFTARSGAVLDLSGHWDALTAARPQRAILPDPDGAPWREAPGKPGAVPAH